MKTTDINIEVPDVLMPQLRAYANKWQCKDLNDAILLLIEYALVDEEERELKLNTMF